MWEFFGFVLNIFGWIIEGIKHVLYFIEAIPTYITYVNNLSVMYVPDFLLPFIILGLTITVIIHIKRLVF